MKHFDGDKWIGYDAHTGKFFNEENQPKPPEAPGPAVKAVPAATGMWSAFNVNNYVRVKLTDIGLAEFRRRHEELNSRLPPDTQVSTTPELDAEGYYITQMWDLMRDFGHLMSMVGDPPFETSVLIDSGDLKRA